MRGHRITIAFGVLLIVGAAFYLWTGATTSPLSLHESPADYYTELASAFLHLHLSVGAAPAGLAHLADPYDPAQNGAYQGVYHDLALYHGRLYLTWGPAPVVVLFVPLHLIGLAPTPSLAVALFGIVGLGFALAALRVLVDEIKGVPPWMAILAGVTLVCSTTIPFLLRRPAVYEEAIAGGFCFAMAGVFIAVRALTGRRSPLLVLAAMSACFGLAAGSRPTLVATGLLIIPVYRALRTARPRRQLLIAVAGPFVACGVLLLAYNAARFGNPLEVGQSYALASVDPQHITYGGPAFLAPNLWFYLIAPPRPTILFPFLLLTPPPLTYPLAFPAGYSTPELTGGLFAMTPLLLFGFAVPWLRRRHPDRLGRLGDGLLALAGAGLFALLFVSYELFASTERYEADFAALFLLVALAAWFSLSTGARGRRRTAVRALGAVLAVWGCFTGLAISFTGYYNLLAGEHPGTWRTLEDLTSPVSTAIAMVARRPILAEVDAPGAAQVSPLRLTTIGAGVQSFSLPPGVPANLTVVSPDQREAAVVATMEIGGALRSGGTLSVRVTDASARPHFYQIVANGLVRIPIALNRGLNRLVITPIASATNPVDPAAPASEQLLIVPSLTIAGHY